MQRKIIFSIKIIKIGFLCGCLLIFTKSFLLAQQLKIKKVHVFYDSSAVPELFQEIPIGFSFIFKDGKKKATSGFLHGKIRWKKLDIYSEQGEVNQGRLRFYRDKVLKNNHNVTFRVSYADTTLYCDLALPYLQQIHFNLYTDSIKKQVPYYLNVEGTFSNGKVYPLDTERIHFSGSAGRIENNVLEYSGRDSAKEIGVRAVFKLDSAINAQVVIPVKTYIEEVRLPTEKELLQRWKKKNR